MLPTVSTERNRKTKYLLVGEAPGAEEVREGRPFVGRSGRILFSALGTQGFAREDFTIANVCEHRPPDNKIEAMFVKPWKVPGPELAAGIEKLKALIDEMQPTAILGLGNTPLWALTGQIGVSNRRGSVYDYNGIPFLPTLHPAFVMRKPKNGVLLARDFQKFKLLVEGKLPQNRERKLVINPTSEDLELAWQEYQSAEIIACDIEAGSNVLSCVGFSAVPEIALSVPYDTPERQEWIRRVLEADTPKVFHNSPFDVPFLQHREGIRVGGRIHDTLAMHQALHPEMPRDLGTLTSLYTNQPYYKFMGQDWAETQDLTMYYQYNALDCSVTREIYTELDKRLNANQRKIYESVLDVMPYAYKMSLRGVAYDQAEADRLLARARRFKKRWTTVVEGRIGRPLLDEMIAKKVIKRKRKKDPYVFNPGSDDQVRYLLFNIMQLPVRKLTAKAGKAATGAIVLQTLYASVPDPLIRKILRGILEYKGHDKLIGSYFKAKTSSDKRMHTSFNPAGTETGRWSASKFLITEGANLQTVPPEWKSCFVPDPGMILWNADYSQIEARFVAYLAQDLGQIKIFEEGGDIHKYNASLIFGKPMDQITPIEREIAKRSVHALNYGVGPQTLMEQANNDNPNKASWLTLDKAKWVRNIYLTRFTKIVEWQENTWEQVKQTRKLVTPFGRERIFLGPTQGEGAHHTQHEAFAYVPQSMVPDLFNVAIRRLADNPPVSGVEAQLQIHDAVYGQGPDHDVEVWARKVRETMMIPVTIHGREVIVPVDVKVGYKWNQLAKLSL
jgi:uracil-DNA glycosylase family 4